MMYDKVRVRNNPLKNGSINKLLSYSESINKSRVKKKKFTIVEKLFFVGQKVTLTINLNKNW